MISSIVKYLKYAIYVYIWTLITVIFVALIHSIFYYINNGSVITSPFAHPAFVVLMYSLIYPSIIIPTFLIFYKYRFRKIEVIIISFIEIHLYARFDHFIMWLIPSQYTMISRYERAWWITERMTILYCFLLCIMLCKIYLLIKIKKEMM